MTTKLEQAARQAFETWWEREGQEFLFALNTTTDDDIKLVAEIAWKNGAYCAEQAEQEPIGFFKQNDEGFWFEASKYYNPKAIPLYAAAQPVKQEPVAEVVLRNQTVGFGRTEERKDVMFLADVDVGTKLYAKPQQQAEQEPVVKIHKYNEFQTLGSLNLPIGTKLYVAPVRTKDLTDYELDSIDDANWENDHKTWDIKKFARAVIAKDREKNNANNNT